MMMVTTTMMPMMMSLIVISMLLMSMMMMLTMMISILKLMMESTVTLDDVPGVDGRAGPGRASVDGAGQADRGLQRRRL